MESGGLSSSQQNRMRRPTKMAAVAKIALLLLCCPVAPSTGAEEQCDSYAAVGATFRVPLGRQLEKGDTLKWRKTSVIFHRRHGDAGYEFVTGKADNVYEDGSLKLTDLKKTDAGTYTPEVYSEGGKAARNLKSMQLCVLDPVAKPKVKMECSSSKLIVSCMVSKTGNPTTVLLRKNEVTKKTQYNVKDVQADSFSCRARNNVSSETSDPVTQTCYTPSFSLPEELMGVSIWVFVGSGGGLAFLLMIITIACCIRTKRKKRMQVKDEEELRLEWTNPEHQQQQQQHPAHQHQHHHHHLPDHHHHHHHHQQQQPAGHTGPRQHRSKQNREQLRPRAPNPPNGHPQPSPRMPGQAPRAAANNDDEQPPPLPQPRKKAPKTQRA